MEADTASPLILPMARPPVILRLKITVSSSISISSARMASMVSASSTKKISSTKADSPLSRSISFWTFSPKARLIDPMIMDFPAPVSPDKILSPGPNSTSVSSINARFFTCRFCNIRSPSTLPKSYYAYLPTILRSFFIILTASSSSRIMQMMVSSPAMEPTIS